MLSNLLLFVARWTWIKPMHSVPSSSASSVKQSSRQHRPSGRKRKHNVLLNAHRAVTPTSRGNKCALRVRRLRSMNSPRKPKIHGLMQSATVLLTQTYITSFVAAPILKNSVAAPLLHALKKLSLPPNRLHPQFPPLRKGFVVVLHLRRRRPLFNPSRLSRLRLLPLRKHLRPVALNA